METKNIEIQEVKERRKHCFNRSEHYSNLLIWGYCSRCDREFALPVDESPLFDRLQTIKNLSV